MAIMKIRGDHSGSAPYNYINTLNSNKNEQRIPHVKFPPGHAGHAIIAG